MNKGFTLIELLVVIIIVATIGASTSVLFSKVQEDNNNEKLQIIYKDIQRAAKLYIDLNEDWKVDFTKNEETYVTVSELSSKGFIKSNIKNPITKETIPGSYIIKIYIKDKTSDRYVDTCLLTSKKECVATSSGESTGCCE